jgi:dihydroneopterin aldolase
MKGLVGFHRQAVSCIIGVHPEERVKEQTIYISVKVQVDFTLCMYTDDVGHTIDYALLAQRCEELAQQKKFFLLETLASHLLEMIFTIYDVEWAWIEICKPEALPRAECAVVELQRTRSI